MDIGTRGHLLEFLRYERGYIVEIPDAVGDQILLDRQEQVFLQHALNDILRRTEYVVVLVTYLDLCQCGLVDVEGLIHQFYLLARLGVIPLLEVRLDVLVDVVRPVKHFELMCAVRTATGYHDEGQSHKVQCTKE